MHNTESFTYFGFFEIREAIKLILGSKWGRGRLVTGLINVMLLLLCEIIRVYLKINLQPSLHYLPWNSDPGERLTKRLHSQVFYLARTFWLKVGCVIVFIVSNLLSKFRLNGSIFWSYYCCFCFSFIFFYTR